MVFNLEKQNNYIQIVYNYLYMGCSWTNIRIE